MSQHALTLTAGESGTARRTALQAALQALGSESSGTSAPATTYAYQWWADTANGLLKQRSAANSAWIVRGTLAETRVLSKSGAYTVAVGDFNSTIKATGTWTLSLLAAATAADGFVFAIRNAGSGSITIDPNGGEQIDGAATVVLAAGESCFLACDGSAWYTIGKPVSSASIKLFNWIVDGQFLAQRIGPTATLSTSAQYGTLPMWAGWASGGAISAGTLTRTTTSTAGRSGRALHFSGVTTTGAGVLSARQRISASDSQQIKNQTVSLQFQVWQDTGASVNVTVVLRKPTVTNDYSAVTVIHTAGAVAVPSGTAAAVTIDNVALGDVANGLEIEVQAAVGAVTNKNLHIADAAMIESATFTDFQRDDPVGAEADLSRYYQSTFPAGVAPAQNAGVTGALSVQTVSSATDAYLDWRLPAFLRAAPGTVTTYNPSASNANWRDPIAAADRTVTVVESNAQRVLLKAAAVANGYAQIHCTVDARL